jgi:hypothetical protein
MVAPLGIILPRVYRRLTKSEMLSGFFPEPGDSDGSISPITKWPDFGDHALALYYRSITRELEQQRGGQSRISGGTILGFSLEHCNLD